MSTRQPSPPRALLTLRSFVLIMVATLIGGAAVALVVLTSGSTTAAVFAGAAAFAGCLKLLHDMVE